MHKKSLLLTTEQKKNKVIFVVLFSRMFDRTNYKAEPVHAHAHWHRTGSNMATAHGNWPCWFRLSVKCGPEAVLSKFISGSRDDKLGDIIAQHLPDEKRRIREILASRSQGSDCVPVEVDSSTPLFVLHSFETKFIDIYLVEAEKNWFQFNSLLNCDQIYIKPQLGFVLMCGSCISLFHVLNTLVVLFSFCTPRLLWALIFQTDLNTLLNV